MPGPSQQEALFSLVQELIRIPSLSGQEEALALLLRERMPAFGFTDIETDLCGNVIGRMRFGDGGPRLLLESHMDHVGVNEAGQWSHYPYGGECADGKIWGRASSDNKGALGAMIMAAALLGGSNGATLEGELCVAAAVHQETFEGVASASIADIVKPDFVIVGEASGNALMRGQRGRAEIVLQTRGRRVHSSMPEAGVNAVKKMLRLIAALEADLVLPVHPDLGESIMELIEIVSLPASGENVVPDLCTARFDRRLLVGETRESVPAQIRAIIDELAGRDERFEASVQLAVHEKRCYTGTTIRSESFYPAWLLEKGHPFVLKASEGLKRAGITPHLSVYPWCTNGSRYAGTLGIPTLGFGPYPMSITHIDDEYIEKEDLVRLCRGYREIACSVLGA